MARSRQSRASRTLLVFVVASITFGAAYQLHRSKKNTAVAATPTTAPSNNAVKTVSLNPKDIPATQPSLMLAAVTDVSAAKPTSQPVAMMASNLIKPVIAQDTINKPAPVSSNPFTEAKTKSDRGDLLAARDCLNNALLSGNLNEADTESAKKQISTLNQTLIFSPKHFANDAFGGVYSVKPGQKLAVIANEHGISWQLLLKLNGMSDPRKLRAGQTLKVLNGPMHAVVTKSKFTMDIYLGSPGEAGSMYVTTFNVGLGKDDSTPTGKWLIKDKVTHPTYYSPRGEGVISSDDPKNPLGPYWLGLTGTDGHAVGKASYGIHGTIEPDSIGKLASMGCVRLRNEEIAVVYDLLVEQKSTVLVKD